MSSNQETIGLVQDYTIGDETHTVAVDNYLRPVFEGWVRANRVSGAYGQVREKPCDARLWRDSDSELMLTSM